MHNEITNIYLKRLIRLFVDDAFYREAFSEIFNLVSYFFTF